MMSSVHVLTLISDRKGTETENYEYFSHFINELVVRSLLEIEESSDRYHFHRLIKEYLLLYKSAAEKRNPYEDMERKRKVGRVTCAKVD